MEEQKIGIYIKDDERHERFRSDVEEFQSTNIEK
jgi:hypothetical protein